MPCADLCSLETDPEIISPGEEPSQDFCAAPSDWNVAYHGTERHPTNLLLIGGDMGLEQWTLATSPEPSPSDWRSSDRQLDSDQDISQVSPSTIPNSLRPWLDAQIEAAARRILSERCTPSSFRSSSPTPCTPAVTGRRRSSHTHAHSPNPDTQSLRCWDHSDCNGRKFSTHGNLVRHKRERAQQLAKVYCPKCGANFSRTTARDKHILNQSCSRVRRHSNGRLRPSIAKLLALPMEKIDTINGLDSSSTGPGDSNGDQDPGLLADEPAVWEQIMADDMISGDLLDCDWNNCPPLPGEDDATMYSLLSVVGAAGEEEEGKKSEGKKTGDSHLSCALMDEL